MAGNTGLGEVWTHPDLWHSQFVKALYLQCASDFVGHFELGIAIPVSDPSRPLAQPVCQSFIPPMCQRLCRSFPAPSNHSSFRPIQTFGTASLSKLYTRQCASDSVSHFELGITIPVSLHHAPKQRAFDLPWNRTFSRGDMATCQLTAASRLSACCHCF